MTVRLATVAAFVACAWALPAAAGAADRLPDLDQALPTGLEVAVEKGGAMPRFHLGFDSSVDNAGPGPLIVDAHRDSTADKRMTAAQLVRQDDGSMRRIKDVGALEYVYSPDHDHWHYLGFDRYELRRASDYLLVAPDQKTGFCLGDRYDTFPDDRIPGEPAGEVYTSRCGIGRTDLHDVREGISAGFGDVYYAQLEGQFVDVTGVAPGQYYLVHRVNADGKLLDADHSNDAASLLLSLDWPDGRDRAPRIEVLRSCRDRETCPSPDLGRPVLDRLAARRYARIALRRGLGFTPKGFRYDCSKRVPDKGRRCKVRGSRGHRRYSSNVTVRYQRADSGVLFARYSAGTIRRDLRCEARHGRRCIVRLKRASGRIRIGPVSEPASAGVAQSRKRLVALDDAPLDGVALGPVVHEVPSLVGDPLGRASSSLLAQ